MRITIEQATKQIEEFLTECDLDELGRITGEIFGGKCFPIADDENDLGSDMVLDFEPDENYCGAFDEDENDLGIDKINKNLTFNDLP